MVGGGPKSGIVTRACAATRRTDRLARAVLMSRQPSGLETTHLTNRNGEVPRRYQQGLTYQTGVQS